jgi:hypothetical protein
VTRHDKEKRDQLFRIMAALDGHFAAADVSEGDADRRRAFKRHVVRMKDGLDLVATELRERKMPLADEVGCQLEDYARFRLGEKQ